MSEPASAGRVVAFGEVMLRLCPEGCLRLGQSLPGRLEATFAGGELNVAVSIARQGGQSAFLTAVPDNPLTDALIADMRGHGVDDDLVVRTAGRFGAFFVETGANQRSGTVTYDRSGSAMAIAPAEVWDWDRAFAECTWLHFTGITPAIGAAAAEAAQAAVTQARSRGVTVSCDLNFRKKLWRWSEGAEPPALARQTMRQLMPHVDVVVANEEDADLALGIAAENTNVQSGELSLEGYRATAAEIVRQFPNVSRVAITLRQSISASHNNWAAMLYEAETGQSHFAPLDEHGEYRPYEIRNIVDRVGAGDSFAGALIFALRTPELANPATALRYATAASCLKHSIKGDFNFATRGEIEALMAGDASGRVRR